MEHIFCNCDDKTKIRVNKYIAISRIKSKKNPTIIDSFFQIEHWPHYIVLLFFENITKYHNHHKIISFFFGNGLSRDQTKDFIMCFHKGLSKLELDHLLSLYDTLTNSIHKTIPNWNHYYTKYYYYSMILGHEIFFDGYLRINSVKTNQKPFEHNN